MKSESLFLKALKSKIFKKIFFLRLSAILGKDCNKNFISDTLVKLKLNRNVEIWNARKLYNNFIHIDDISKFIIHLINNYSKYPNKFIFNCLASSPLTTFQTINFMKSELSSKSEFIINKKKVKHLKLKQKKPNKYFQFQTAKKTIKLFLRS